MTMLFISTGEVVILLFAVLMLFGPDRLPGFVRSLAKGIRTVKNAQADLTQQMSKMAEDQPGVSEVSKVVEDLKSDIEGVVPRKK
jgi:sec-independent protein translocase protein TatA